MRLATRSLLLGCLLVSMAALPLSGQSFSKSPRAPGGSFTPPREAPGGACGTTTITHSVSQAIVFGNSVACTTIATGTTTDNFYYRVFNLADYGFAGFDVCSVDIGIESADSVTGISVPLEVRLYTTPTGTFPGGALTPIGSAPSLLGSGTALTIVEVPVVGALSVPDDLVVEIFTPDGFTDGWGIWLGSNASGESGPSYIAAPDCGIGVPTPLAAIGFPDMHIVMNVNGTPAGCTLTCPADIQVDNDPGLCSADLGAPLPTPNGDCGPVLCYPVTMSARGSVMRAAPLGTSNCCDAWGGLGCDDPTCESQICASDSFCCSVEWDSICAADAVASCTVCGGVQTYPVGTTTIYCEEQPLPQDRPTEPEGTSDCCFANGTPGCDDPTCEATVCALDPFCCDTAWDSICADNAAFLCAICQGPASNCCEPWGGLGCDDPGCESTVCAIDPFCCDTAWDSICAGEAANLCAICGGTPPASCSYNITVVDAEAPVVPAPDAVIGTDPGLCTAVYNFPVSYTDNCPGGGPATCNPPSGFAFPLGDTVVTCSATDAAGNPGQDTGTITVQDVEAPVATAPDAVIGTDDGLCTAVYVYVPGYADNCPGGSTVCAPPSGFAFPLGDTLVSCTATDAGGLQGFDTGTVTVYDDEAPVIACPADQFATAPPGALSWPVSYPDPTFSDNCPGVTAGCAPPSGDPFPIGTTTVNCSALDGAGLTAACAFDVTVTTLSIVDIPTASTLGLMALALLLAGAAFVVLRRHG